MKTLMSKINLLESSEMNEIDLLSSLKKGDERALTDLVALHQEAIISYVYCMSGDMAHSKDICQETFLKLIKSPPLFISGKSLRSWLIRVARNKFLDSLRRQKIHVQNFDGDYESSTLAPDKEIIYLQDSEQILKCLKSLPDSLRETVEMRIYEELNFREISEKTGTPLGTVLWRMQKALGLLKSKFREQDS